jgi:hypothetical protein
MELTQQCLEEIIMAAKEVERNGSLTITIQARPEDRKKYDMKVAYENRFRIDRNGRSAIPSEMTGSTFPQNKF